MAGAQWKGWERGSGQPVLPYLSASSLCLRAVPSISSSNTAHSLFEPVTLNGSHYLLPQLHGATEANSNAVLYHPLVPKKHTTPGMHTGVTLISHIPVVLFSQSSAQAWSGHHPSTDCGLLTPASQGAGIKSCTNRSCFLALIYYQSPPLHGRVIMVPNS